MWQQDNAPSHVSKKTMTWLRTHWTTALGVELLSRPPQSPDLSVLDYSIWGALEAGLPLFPNTVAGRAALKAEVARRVAIYPAASVSQALAVHFVERLKACIRAGGGHFEHLV